MIDALFDEARDLACRRRRRYFLLAVLVCALAAGIALASGTGQRGVPASHPALSAPVAVSSAVLPRAGDYTLLAVVGGRLIVSGGPEGSLLDSGSITSLVGGRAEGTCTAGTVDPVSLKLSAVDRRNCGDPALHGERVLPISSLFKGAPASGGTDTVAVRVATVDPAARDGYVLGPIVVAFPQCSSCSVEWIYGNGSLWLYAPLLAGTRTSGSGELLLISEQTGRVQQRWSMPTMSRALLAVDSDGLWIAPSLFTGFPPHVSASQQIRYDSLYRVSAGMRAPARSFTVGLGGAYWMVASGHTVWLDVTRGHGPSVLWRLQGARAVSTIRGRPLADGPGCIQSGERSATIAGNAAIGLYCLSTNGNGAAIRINPNGDGARTVATASLPRTTYLAPAVVLGGSFFLLIPAPLPYPGANSPPVVQGQGVLYRITPNSDPPLAASSETPSSRAHGGRGRITLGGRVGALQLDRSTQIDVLGFGGEPDATGRGNFDAIPHRPNYFALGYFCQRHHDRGLGVVDGSAYCKTVFYLNSRTERLVGFHTSSPTYSFEGASPGTPTPRARRQMHRFARSGCLTGFLFINRHNHASLFGEVDGGRATRYRHGANTIRRITGGHLEALELESNRHPIGLLFC